MEHPDPGKKRKRSRLCERRKDGAPRPRQEKEKNPPLRKGAKMGHPDPGKKRKGTRLCAGRKDGGRAKDGHAVPSIGRTAIKRKLNTETHLRRVRGDGYLAFCCDLRGWQRAQQFLSLILKSDTRIAFLDGSSFNWALKQSYI